MFPKVNGEDSWIIEKVGSYKTKNTVKILGLNQKSIIISKQ